MSTNFQKGWIMEVERSGWTAFKLCWRERDAAGVWAIRYRTMERGTIRKEAERELDAVLRPINDQMSAPAPVRNTTVGDLLDNHWDSYAKRKNLRPSTAAGYSSMISNWVRPFFGNLELAKVTPETITAFMTGLADAKLADKYQKNIYNFTMLLFELAKTYDLIQRNPVRPLLHRPSVERTEKMTMPREKVRDFFLALPVTWRTPVLTLLLTGMRQGELLGLRWQDIDFAGKVIHKRNVVFRGKLLVGLKNTKKAETKPREHHVNINPLLLRVLEERKSETPFPGDTDFVFCREDGSPLDPDHMRNYVLYPAMDAAGIERQKRGSGLHMFRHTAGSVVYSVTGDLKKAQDQLGHSDIQTTGRYYVHTDAVQKEAAASALENAFAADLLPAFASQSI